MRFVKVLGSSLGEGTVKCLGLHKWNKEFKIQYHIVGMIGLPQCQWKGAKFM